MTTLSGTITKDGHTVTFTKVPPRVGYGGYKKERGLRTIHVDGVLRGYVIMPNGWGKYPVIQNLEQFNQGVDERTNVKTIYTDTKSEYCLDFTAEAIIQDLMKRDVLPTQEEINAKNAEKEAAQKQQASDREKFMQEWIAEGIDTINKMVELRKKLGNVLNDEDTELLKKVTKKLFGAYHADVGKHFKDKEI